MDTILKQRLVGAIVLISLGVIFIPMLLTGKGDLSSGDMTSNIPPEPEYDLSKPPVSVSGQVKPADATSSEKRRVVTLNVPIPAQPEHAQPVSPGVADKATTTANTSPPAKTSPIEPSHTKPPSDAATTATKTETRENSSATAAVASGVSGSSTLNSTKKSTSKSGETLRTAQATTKPAPAKPDAAVKPASAISGWVVQVGSFEQRSNANQLRDKLRRKGFAAFVEPRKDSHDKVYRVRVGPELKRSTAEDLQKKLLKREKLKGIVMQYPTRN